MKKLLWLFLVAVLLLTSCSMGASDTSDDVELPEESFLEVHYIDVGQADSTLVVCDGKTLLIDGGNAADSSLIYSYLKKNYISHLDYVIATHAHEDHIGGLAGAMTYADVEEVLCPTDDYESAVFQDFLKYVEKEGVDIQIPSAGDTFELGSAVVDILACNAVEEINGTSIVLKVTYGDTAFLFTADAERDTEQVILESGADLKSTVLKVGHHGSSASTTYPFLREVMPEYAVISVGEDNSYGHPHEETLSRLEDADVKIYRTDLHGTVICTSDGTSVSFTTDKKFSNISTEDDSEGVEIEAEYVLNTNSMRFHTPYCSGVTRISDKNKKIFTGSREELIELEYIPCGSCNP